jgi:hypothetical protein
VACFSKFVTLAALSVVKGYVTYVVREMYGALVGLILTGGDSEFIT